MRVLLDANVLLSYLLSPDTNGTIARVVRVCLQSEEIDLLVPQPLLEQVESKAATKPYFMARINRPAVERFVARLTTVGEFYSGQDVPGVYTRDRKDDYLVAFGVLYEADYLVSGDQDLLVLKHIGSLRILTPAAFVDELVHRGLLDD